MGHQIIKQPNGKFSIFSTVVDHFIVIDATPEEIIEYYVKEETEDITANVNAKVEALNRGEKPYGQFTQDWEETLEIIEGIHGKSDKFLKQIKKTIGEKQC